MTGHLRFKSCLVRSRGALRSAPSSFRYYQGFRHVSGTAPAHNQSQARSRDARACSSWPRRAGVAHWLMRGDRGIRNARGEARAVPGRRGGRPADSRRPGCTRRKWIPGWQGSGWRGRGPVDLPSLTWQRRALADLAGLHAFLAPTNPMPPGGRFARSGKACCCYRRIPRSAGRSMGWTPALGPVDPVRREWPRGTISGRGSAGGYPCRAARQGERFPRDRRRCEAYAGLIPAASGFLVPANGWTRATGFSPRLGARAPPGFGSGAGSLSALRNRERPAAFGPN